MNAAANGSAPVRALVKLDAAGAIEPRSMGELQALAKAAAGSGFFGAKTPDQALLICMSGRDLGLSYSQALRAFHVIEGKPSLSADGMVAACLVRRDVCERFRTLESTNERATVETKRIGQEPQQYTFTIADAQRAELAGRANWKRYPSRMLLARARAALARDVYPDLLLGLYDPDELQEAAYVAPAPAPARVVTVDGEVIEPRSPKVQAAVEQARAAVDAAPPLISTQPESPFDKAIEEHVLAFEADYERMAREGTMTGHTAIGKKIAALNLPVGSPERTRLVKAGREAAEAIRHRVTASQEAQAAFGDHVDVGFTPGGAR